MNNKTLILLLVIASSLGIASKAHAIPVSRCESGWLKTCDANNELFQITLVISDGTGGPYDADPKPTRWSVQATVTLNDGRIAQQNTYNDMILKNYDDGSESLVTSGEPGVPKISLSTYASPDHRKMDLFQNDNVILMWNETPFLSHYFGGTLVRCSKL